MFNKRGKQGKILLETIIFIVLNLIFLSSVFVFARTKASDASFYQEVYAKQIALLIDNARPGTNIILDITEFEKRIPNSRVVINNIKKQVEISGKDKDFTHPFLTSNQIEFETEHGKLILKVFSSKPTNVENL
jgi:hypothetical protein